ncbi:MAG: ERF family protein [Thermoplasmata archaeon]|nr:ERF family protein [Thermoplasmata archaeon]MBE3142092.1 ERF family protein [Thermoplasmata archaeon]
MEKIRRSESIKSYVVAMIKVQGVMGKATRSSDNPFFSSKYADLETVNDCIHAAMTEAKSLFLIQQYPTVAYIEEKQHVTVTTRVTDPSSGEWEEFDIECIPVKQDPQAVGSAITYLRRYGLMSMFNISPEDDDGNAGSKPDPMDQRQPEERHTSNGAPRSQPNPRPPAARPPARPASQPQASKQQGQPIPTTGQLNQELKTIPKERVDDLTEACVKNRISSAEWKKWLQGVYGYTAANKILMTQYAGIMLIASKKPEIIKVYGMDPAVVRTPPLPDMPEPLREDEMPTDLPFD